MSADLVGVEVPQQHATQQAAAPAEGAACAADAQPVGEDAQTVSPPKEPSIEVPSVQQHLNLLSLCDVRGSYF